MGGLIDVKWAIEQRTYCGDVCNAQGALAQIGVTATAFFTTAISIQTCVSLVTWGYVILIGVVGWLVNPDFYVPDPLWCWIRPKYRLESLFGQYIPLWVCGFGNVLIYIPLYLFSRGNLDLEGGGDGRIRWKWYRRALNDPEREELRSQAWKMLLYPSAYTLQILGTSIVRWMSYINPSLIDLELPELAGMAAASLLFRWVLRLSGFINVLLILTTRPNVLLFGSRGVLPVGDPRAMHNEEFQQHESNTIAEMDDVSMSDLNHKLGSRRSPGSRD
ncbi:hypothetical protein CTheo_235 [Ceratobasidium theobromae]|uniref:Uncharacterized protein n=1 Tax=Ceratobasidium theobromae TaxID=1582974 RepID=A0A5N5QWX4_9AGAM|nr:hypothetical protein CTheo_235 [Ceratobasidium theobromae]